MTTKADSKPVLDGFVLVGAGEKFRDEICDMIGDSQLFASMAWPDVEGLARYVQCYEIKSGTVVFREGESGSFMCLIVKGRVEIYKEAQKGRQQRLVCISRGKTVGEMAMIDNEPRSATCIAKEDSLMLILSRQSYETIIRDRPALAVQITSRIARQLSQRMRSLNGQLVEYLGHDEADTKCE